MTSLYLELVSLHASERENELINKKLKSLKLEANEICMFQLIHEKNPMKCKNLTKVCN
jgi:hypothetical protein